MQASYTYTFIFFKRDKEGNKGLSQAVTAEFLKRADITAHHGNVTKINGYISAISQKSRCKFKNKGR